MARENERTMNNHHVQQMNVDIMKVNMLTSVIFQHEYLLDWE